MKSPVGFYAVKITAIFLMSVIYFVLGAGLSLLLNRSLPADPVQQVSTPMLVVRLSAVFGLIGVVYYLLRNVVKRAPFPLDGWFGFRYSMLREATGGLIVAYAMYSYLDRLHDWMVELEERVTGEKPSDTSREASSSDSSRVVPLRRDVPADGQGDAGLGSTVTKRTLRAGWAAVG
jgi:hypothetical protein